MAKEDLLAQLIRQLTQKEGPPEESDNSILQKMVIARDKATLSDSLTVSKFTVATQKWGGYAANGSYVTPGWKWGAGQWKS